MMDGALTGFRVLDFSRLLPGPFCTMLMADMGADVVKVEDPNGGDYIRGWPPLLGGNSGFHIVLNRNKRSLTLNLKSSEGRDILLRLVKAADVVLEGFRPGVMKKLGLDYDTLKTINPRLVYCTINGYGFTGEKALRAGHDINFLALSGVLSYSGRKGLPTMSGVQIADMAGGGLLAAFSIVSALLARERIGEGQFIDISMTDGSMLMNCLRWGKFIADKDTPSPGDSLLNHGFACYNIYETQDGRFMSLGALEPQFFKAFCLSVGHPEWNQPSYFEPGPHQQTLKEQIAAVFREKTLAGWTEHFKDIDCCCEPILNLDEVMSAPMTKAREMVVELVHESWGAYRQLGIAQKFSRTPGTIHGHAPELGEHTRPILQALGFTASQIESLKARGVA